MEARQTSADDPRAEEETSRHQQHPAHDSSQTSFLDLPRELRDRIYDLLITDTKYVYDHGVKAFTHHAPSAPALLCASSQMHQEYTDRLPKKRNLTVHGYSNRVFRTAPSLTEELASAVDECTVYLPIFLGHGSLSKTIKQLSEQLYTFAEHFPHLRSMHVKFASRCLVGYSSSETRACPEWTLETAVDALTTGPWMQDLEIFEGTDHVVPCKDCRDLYRPLCAHAGNGKHCECRACKSFYQRPYMESEDDERAATEPATCQDCGRHNFYRWGVWSRTAGWTYFVKRKSRR